MAKDKFNQIVQEISPMRFHRQGSQWYGAVGNDDINTNLVIGSKDGGDGNVTDLQKALNRLGGKPTLTTDGKFGSNTKTSLKSLGYSYPVTSSVFYKVLNDANKGDASNATATVSDADMKALWAKDKTKYGKLSSEPDYDKWLKRQKTLAGIKDFGKGAFTVALDFLKQKQLGSPTDYSPNEPTDTSRIWGMPAPVVYIGGAVVGGLLIWGAVALVTRKPKQMVVQQIPVAR